MSNITIPAAIKTLNQIQGVEHVLVHVETPSGKLHRAIVFTEDATVDATLETTDELNELAEIVETYTTNALVNKKFKLNFRITL